MDKKAYMTPDCLVVEMGCEDELMKVSGEGPSEGNNFDQQLDPDEGEDMGVKASNIWEEW